MCIRDRQSVEDDPHPVEFEPEPARQRLAVLDDRLQQALRERHAAGPDADRGGHRHEPEEYGRLPFDETRIVQGQRDPTECEYQQGTEQMHRWHAPQAQVIADQQQQHCGHEHGSGDINAAQIVGHEKRRHRRQVE